MNRQIENIALVGFMGTGKSCVGRLVAGQLQFAYLDTDQLIEERVGRRISDIFAQQGEAWFREYERKLFHELMQLQQTVISAGGGAVAYGDNMQLLKSRALVICLWATPQTIWERVRAQSHRPLLRTEDPYARICQLLAEREPFYRQADVLLNTEARSLKEVAQQVIHQFRLVRPAKE